MNTSFGSYIKGNSLIHKFDPRLKLFSIIALIVAVFLDNGFVGYFILVTWLVLFIWLSNLPIRLFLRTFKVLIFITIFLFIINCFLVKGNENDQLVVVPSKDYPIFVISYQSIFSSLYIGFRIFLMINITTLLTATTKSLDLTLAIEDLLWPLKLLKVPISVISTIISIAFRMIPTLLQEASRIRKAQASRGVDHNNAKINEKIKSLVSLIIPLLVSSFQKAEDLSYAMDSRGYNPQIKRTRFRKFKINFVDILLFLFSMLFAVIIYTNFAIHFIPALPIDQYVSF